MDHGDRHRAGLTQAEALFAQAVRHHSAGRLDDAEKLYRRIFEVDPRHADSLHRLGVIAYQRGQFGIAIDLLHKTIALRDKVATYHGHLSSALAAAGRLEEAARAGATAVDLAPDAAEARIGLGLILLQLGRLAEAADLCRQAALLAPDLPDAHGSLGAILQEMGQAGDAAETYRRAIALDPNYPEAQTGLGNALFDLGAPDEAIAHHRQAIALRPAFAEAHYNLAQPLLHVGDLNGAMDHLRLALKSDPGLIVAHRSLARILKGSGRLADAEATLRQALATTPQHPDLLNDLALTLLAQDRRGEATQVIAGALAVQETDSARSTLVDCIERLDIGGGADSMAPVLVRALRESWARPERLARISLDIVRQDPAIGAAVARAAALWPGPATEVELFGERGLASVAANVLLQVLLSATPNADFRFERFLTLTRQVLLDSAERDSVPDAALNFYAALARQCFVNEYVFRFSEDERLRAGALRARLVEKMVEGAAISSAHLLTVSSYYPLAGLPGAERLLARRWPAAIEDVLIQQIREVATEAALSAEISQLTPVKDTGSIKVQAQYEANPYPRWLDAGSSPPPQDITAYLAATFPLSGVQPVPSGPSLDILVAGCGTGRNALDTARAFKGGRTLAIDLSLASLAHALRKTREAGISDITYARADILEVQSLGLTFDLIESVGVLHHLSDPLAGLAGFACGPATRWCHEARLLQRPRPAETTADQWRRGRRRRDPGGSAKPG